MRFLPLAACFGAALFCTFANASVLPTVHLDPESLHIFQNYVAQFNQDIVEPYVKTGKMWIDDSTCCLHKAAFEHGKPVIEPRENTEIANGSIHHFTVVMHLPGQTIANVRRIMQDYPNYPRYFKPDVGRGSGVKDPHSTPQDEHYISQLSLIQNTLWIAVSYDCTYDTHYRMLDAHHWESISTATDIREWRDPKDPAQGYLPEGDDHGFIWRTNTYWFVRDREDGIDLELDSITLSRPVPTGFGWWGTKRTREAVENMMKDMKAAVENIH